MFTLIKNLKDSFIFKISLIILLILIALPILTILVQTIFILGQTIGSYARCMIG